MSVRSLPPGAVRCEHGGEYRHPNGFTLKIGSALAGSKHLNVYDPDRHLVGTHVVKLLNDKGHTEATYPSVSHSPQYKKLATVDQISAAIYVFFIILGGLAAVTAFILWRRGKTEIAQWTAVGSASCFAVVLLMIPFCYWLNKQVEKASDKDRTRHTNEHGYKNFEWFVPPPEATTPPTTTPLPLIE